MSFQLIKKSSVEPLPIPPSIVPKMEDWFIEIVALGCRGLKPYELLPVYLPHVEFDVGSRGRKTSVRVFEWFLSAHVLLVWLLPLVRRTTHTCFASYSSFAQSRASIPLGITPTLWSDCSCRASCL